MSNKLFTKRKMLYSILATSLLCVGCANTQATDDIKSNLIQISAEEITVGGQAISSDTSAAIYASNKIENHEDVTEENKELRNTVINITAGGEYEITGTRENTQIRVNAPEEEVSLILNNLDLSCATAPAIYFEDAYDAQEAGQAGVTLILAEGSTNIINGSHIAEYTDENGIIIDNDGAISSNVSLAIDGTGSLKVQGDKEGIESKLHLTIHNGNLEIISQDDALNASYDGVSTITINDGLINCSVQGGEEGDGIDSNGYIYINDGSILAQADSKSQDSGLDADLGVIINGGTVCATGNMYEEISAESTQAHVQFYFANRQAGGTPLVITDSEGNCILAYTPVNDYTILELSMPDLIDGTTYYLYSGGTITGTLTNGIYTAIESYEGGTQLAHRGTMSAGGKGNFAAGERPKAENRPNANNENKERPQNEGMNRPANPGMTPPNGAGLTPPSTEGMTPPEGMELPEGIEPPTGSIHGGFGGGGFNSQNNPQSVEFLVDADSRVYYCIEPLVDTDSTNNTETDNS